LVRSIKGALPLNFEGNIFYKERKLGLILDMEVSRKTVIIAIPTTLLMFSYYLSEI